MIDDLEHAEEQLKDAMLPFLCTIFSKFYELKDVFQAALNIITELDCLAALSIVSGQSEGIMCRPQFIEYEGEYANSSLLDIK